MKRSDARRLTEASLLTPAEAVRELGGREAVVRKWLKDRGLVRDVPGLGQRVSWRQVLELVETGQGPGAGSATSGGTEPRPGRLPRAGLYKR